MRALCHPARRTPVAHDDDARRFSRHCDNTANIPLYLEHPCISSKDILHGTSAQIVAHLASVCVRHRSCEAQVQQYTKYKARQQRQQIKLLLKSSDCRLDAPQLSRACSPVCHATAPRSKAAAPNSTSERTKHTCIHAQDPLWVAPCSTSSHAVQRCTAYGTEFAASREGGRWGQAPEGAAWQRAGAQGRGRGGNGAAVRGSGGTGSHTPLHGQKGVAEGRGKEKGAARQRSRRPPAQCEWEREWLKAFFATEEGQRGAAGRLHERMRGRHAPPGYHRMVSPSRACFV